MSEAETDDSLFVVLELGAYAAEQLELSARRSDTDAVVATLTTDGLVTRSVAVVPTVTMNADNTATSRPLPLDWGSARKRCYQPHRHAPLSLG